MVETCARQPNWENGHADHRTTASLPQGFEGRVQTRKNRFQVCASEGYIKRLSERSPDDVCRRHSVVDSEDWEALASPGLKSMTLTEPIEFALIRITGSPLCCQSVAVLHGPTHSCPIRREVVSAASSLFKSFLRAWRRGGKYVAHRLCIAQVGRVRRLRSSPKC